MLSHFIGSLLSRKSTISKAPSSIFYPKFFSVSFNIILFQEKALPLNSLFSSLFFPRNLLTQFLLPYVFSIWLYFHLCSLNVVETSLKSSLLLFLIPPSYNVFIVDDFIKCFFKVSLSELVLFSKFRTFIFLVEFLPIFFLYTQFFFKTILSVGFSIFLSPNYYNPLLIHGSFTTNSSALSACDVNDWVQFLFRALFCFLSYDFLF